MAGKRESGQVRATVTGYNRWAFNQLMEADGKDQTEALALVMDHWIASEKKEFLEERGITRQAYNQARGRNVVPMTADRKKPA